MIVEKSSSLTDLIAKLHQAIADNDLPLIQDIGNQIKILNDVQSRSSRKVVMVCNITPESYSATRTFGYIEIKGTVSGEEFHLTPVREYRDRIVYDDAHHIDVTFPASEVAEDLVRCCNSDAGDQDFPNSYLGVFLCDGDTPSAEELRVAKEKLSKFDEHLIHRADTKWSDPHNRKDIMTCERRAAKRHKIEREWLFDAGKAQVDCPACGTRIKPGVAVCMNCNAVINEPLARKFFPERFKQEEPDNEDMEVLSEKKTRKKAEAPKAE